MNYCLLDFPVLTEGKVVNFQGCVSLCKKFYEMGIRKNASVQMVGRLPLSRHVLVLIENESFVLREQEARCLQVCSQNANSFTDVTVDS